MHVFPGLPQYQTGALQFLVQRQSPEKMQWTQQRIEPGASRLPSLPWSQEGHLTLNTMPKF